MTPSTIFGEMTKRGLSWRGTLTMCAGLTSGFLTLLYCSKQKMSLLIKRIMLKFIFFKIVMCIFTLYN
jgi:hypothetical protein